jgi:hypothetical protein
MMRRAGLIGLACSLTVCSCAMPPGTAQVASTRDGTDTTVSRPIPGVRVVLAPVLDGGRAGWCISTARTFASNSAWNGGCGAARPSTGPIFDESCNGNETTYVIVLTRGDVADVAVTGGGPIATESNSALPDGLRGAAIELPGYRIAAKPMRGGGPWSPCPRVTALDADGEALDQQGRPATPLMFQLPTRAWEAPAHPPSGVCRLSSTRLPRETVADEGTVATRVRSFPQLIGHAFISCTETTYIYKGEHHLPAAVLLSATRPGAEPPGLPGAKPFAGHASVFEAPPDMFARRIRGAWLVVQEEDKIGAAVPVELLESLRASVQL